MNAIEGFVQLFAETVLPAEWRERADVLLATVLLLVVAASLRALQAAFSPGDFGSGNNPWFRHIDSTPRCHQKKHFPLEHVWEYTGRGVREVEPQQDAATKYPLTGPLIGRQTWVATGRAADGGRNPLLEPEDGSFDPTKNPHSSDKLLRHQLRASKGLPSPGIAPSRGAIEASRVTVGTALREGIDFMCSLQTEDGHWAGDYGGPFFLLPGFVIMAQVTGFDLGSARRSAMLTYLRNHQQADGSWGLHLEGPGTMLGTGLNYAAARLLGMKDSEASAVSARDWIRRNGGCTGIPAWGKTWLSILGAYEWDGVNPVPPELFCLPSWLPVHPSNFWCHTRMVALPMAALYGERYVGPITPLVKGLRAELYPGQDYNSIQWSSHRLDVCPLDHYAPHTSVFRFVSACLGWYESMPTSWFRRWGIKEVRAYLDAEDEQTNYVCIGPVNKALNMVCAAVFHGRASDEFRKHAARVSDYLYVAEDGMRVQGYGGSQLWDTAFAVQAVMEAGMGKRVEAAMRKSHAFVDASQIRDDVPHTRRFYRDTARGGWTFSTADNAWPVADCTSEGLRASMLLEAAGLTGAGGELEPHRYFDAVNLILAYQNSDGGWPTYERARGSSLLEALNPAEVFGDIMIDYSYIELTSACIQGLAEFQSRFPMHRASEIASAVRRAMRFLRAAQRADGSWYGSWGVCFTYAAWFAVDAIRTAGAEDDGKALLQTCEFLLSKQNKDGGWGETYLSCVRKKYCGAESSVVHTAWALLALIGAQCPHSSAVEAGVAFLIAQQRTDGDWPQGQTAGIFNRSCGISYSNYRNIFPVWALGAYARRYDYQNAALVGTL